MNARAAPVFLSPYSSNAGHLWILCSWPPWLGGAGMYIAHFHLQVLKLQDCLDPPSHLISRSLQSRCRGFLGLDANPWQGDSKNLKIGIKCYGWSHVRIGNFRETQGSWISISISAAHMILCLCHTKNYLLFVPCISAWETAFFVPIPTDLHTNLKGTTLS